MPNFVQRLMPLVIVTSLLTGCAGINSNPDCVCPPVKEYNHKFQSKLAQEVKGAPTDAAFPAALQDYALLRTQLRLCDK